MAVTGPNNAASRLVGFTQHHVDRFVPPESRQRAYTHVLDFAMAHPLLATFILSEVIFCIIPVLVFLAFAGSVFFVAIGAALVFTLFLSGLALLLLVPALFLASAVAATVSVWAVGSFLVAQWLYNVLQQGETTSTLETKIDGGGSREAVKMGPSGIKVDVLGGV